MRNRKLITIFMIFIPLIGFYIFGTLIFSEKKPVNKVYLFSDVNKTVDNYVSQYLPNSQKEKVDFFHSTDFLGDQELLAFQAFDFQYAGMKELMPDFNWQPLVETTCVLAINRSGMPEDISIQSYQDILKNNLKFGLINDKGINCLIDYAVYGALDNNTYKLDNSLGFYKKLYRSDNLLFVKDIFELRNQLSELDVALVLSHQKSFLQTEYPDLEFIVPLEGTVKYSMGLISKPELDLTHVEQAGKDDLADVTLLGKVATVTDYEEFHQVSKNHDFLYRREVLQSRLYSPINIYTTLLTYLAICVIIVVWLVSLYLRIVNQKTRNTMLAVTFTMLFWQLLLIIKRLTRNDLVALYAWYLYYIAILFLPFLLLRLLYSESFPSDQHNKRLNIIFGISFFLVLLTVTNNLHQLVFTFPENIKIADMSHDYSYGFMFYVLSVWVLALYILMGIRFIIIAKRLPNKWRLLAPISIAIIYLTYSIGYIFNVGFFRQSDFGLTVIILYLLFIESWYFAGIFSGHYYYKNIFSGSKLNLLILDQKKKPFLSTQAQIPASVNSALEQLKPGQNDILNQELESDFIINLNPIRGGYAYWWQDISEQKEYQKRLTELSEQLREGNLLLEQREIIEGRAWRARWLTEIYHTLVADLEKELTDARRDFQKLIEEGKDLSENLEVGQPKALADLAFSVQILKRKANLLLLGEIMSSVPLNELLISTEEIFSQLGVNFIILNLDTKDVHLDFADAIILYEIFSGIGKNVQQSNIQDISLKLTLDNKQIKFTLYLDKCLDLDFPKTLINMAKQAQITIVSNAAEDLDETMLTITKTLNGKGAT